MGHTCCRCKLEIPPGGFFYRVKLSAVSGYDGVIDPDQPTDVSAALKEIAGKSAEELEREVYFEHEVILCGACRKRVLETFCKYGEISADSDRNDTEILH